MFQKLVASLTVLLFVSCEKKQEAQTSGSASLPRRSVRTERLPHDAPLTRDKLRSALEEAKTMAPGEERESALEEVARQALDISSDIATEAIKEMMAGSDKKITLIEVQIHKFIDAEMVDEALRWAAALGDEKDTSAALGMVSELVATSNPERLAGMLSPSSFTAAGVDPAADQILQNWIAANPGRAAEWVTKMPVGEARDAGFKALLATWVNMDSKLAFSWVSSQKDTKIRQEAVDAVVQLLVGQPEPLRKIQLEAADKNFKQELRKRIAEPTQDSGPEPEPE